MSTYFETEIRNRFFAGHDVKRLTNWAQEMLNSRNKMNGKKKTVTKCEARHAVELVLKEVKWNDLEE